MIPNKQNPLRRIAFYLGLIYNTRANTNARAFVIYYAYLTGEFAAMKTAISLFKPFSSKVKKLLLEGYREGIETSRKLHQQT